MHDVSGLPLTCGSGEALDSFNAGLMALVTLRESSLPWFREAVERDQDFLLGHSMMVKG